MNALDLFIGFMFCLLIGGMVAKWIDRKRKGAAVSWKSIVAWAGWGAQFLLYETLFSLDQDPNTVTLSELMVGSVPLWQMLTGTWFVCGVLLVHWWDLDRRLAPYLAVAAAARKLLETPDQLDVSMQVDWRAVSVKTKDILDTRKRVLAGALGALPGG